jgi:hypothetical protein
MTEISNLLKFITLTVISIWNIVHFPLSTVCPRKFKLQNIRISYCNVRDGNEQKWDWTHNNNKRNLLLYHSSKINLINNLIITS